MSVQSCKAALRKRCLGGFDTQQTRFRLAVTSGFTIAAVGFSILGANQFGFADTVWGVMPDIFGTNAFDGQPGGARTYAPAQGGYTQHRTRSTRHHVARRYGEMEVRPARFNAKRNEDHDVPTQLGHQSVCVRLCDGFIFPVGTYHGGQDRASHERTCQSECPGAETALYVMPSGADSVGDAVRLDTGKNYSSLPDAYHYTTVLSGACSCHPKSGGRIASLLHDFTLRRGDAVMTPKGVKVFHGGAHYPFRRTDFLALRKSPDVKKQDFPVFHAIEQASLRDPRTLAAASNAAFAPPLVRQASR